MTALGTHLHRPISADELVRWPVNAMIHTIQFDSAELTAVCPVTGQPDSYHIAITFTPQGWTIESKSLKFYLWHYRDEPVSAEDLAVRIADELAVRLETTVTVELDQAVRGGIAVHVQAVGST